MATVRTVGYLVCATALCACGGGSGSGSGGRDNVQLNELRRSLGELKAEVAGLRSDLEFQRTLWRSYAPKDPYAKLDCAAPYYDIVRTRIGSMLIECDRATKYLDGYRLRLKVGNTTSVSLEGLDLQFESLGKTDWKLDRKVTDRFAAGSWHTFEVALPGVTDEMLKDGLALRVEADRVNLFAR
jgi:hypothetical protein